MNTEKFRKVGALPFIFAQLAFWGWMIVGLFTDYNQYFLNLQLSIWLAAITVMWFVFSIDMDSEG